MTPKKAKCDDVRKQKGEEGFLPRIVFVKLKSSFVKFLHWLKLLY